MRYSVCVALSLALAAAARPRHFSRAEFTLQNGKAAIALNDKFKTLNANSPCNAGDQACVNNQFAQCVGGKFVLQSCGSTLVCAALPLVNSAGTSITCTTAADRDARIAATGATSGGSDKGSGNAASTKGSSTQTSSAATSTGTTSPVSNAGSGNSTDTGSNAGSQSSLTLLDSVIAKGFENNGQDQPTAGQVPSLKSSNNFINFCATVPNLPLTNGQQVKGGSCNPAPMGVIASTANMPSSKFVNPKNGATISAKQTFTIQMAVKNLETGNFVNANQNFFSAPQQVNAQGNIKGHSHVVIEAIPALDSTAPTDPAKFAFFKGLNEKDQGGILSVQVDGGLPAGTYRLASINTAANHQPALVAVAQHGSLDDMVYFTVA